MKSAMDWRSLTSDVLTLERRSVGTRQEFQLQLSCRYERYIPFWAFQHMINVTGLDKSTSKTWKTSSEECRVHDPRCHPRQVFSLSIRVNQVVDHTRESWECYLESRRDPAKASLLRPRRRLLANLHLLCICYFSLLDSCVMRFHTVRPMLRVWAMVMRKESRCFCFTNSFASHCWFANARWNVVSRSLEVPPPHLVMIKESRCLCFTNNFASHCWFANARWNVVSRSLEVPPPHLVMMKESRCFCFTNSFASHCWFANARWNMVSRGRKVPPPHLVMMRESRCFCFTNSFASHCWFANARWNVVSRSLEVPPPHLMMHHQTRVPRHHPAAVLMRSPLNKFQVYAIVCNVKSYGCWQIPDNSYQFSVNGYQFPDKTLPFPGQSPIPFPEQFGMFEQPFVFLEGGWPRKRKTAATIQEGEGDWRVKNDFIFTWGQMWDFWMIYKNSVATSWGHSQACAISPFGKGRIALTNLATKVKSHLSWMLRNLLFSWKDAGREEKGQPQQPSDDGVRNPGFRISWWDIYLEEIRVFQSANLRHLPWGNSSVSIGEFETFTLRKFECFNRRIWKLPGGNSFEWRNLRHLPWGH